MGRLANKLLFKKITKGALENQTFYGRLAGKTLNPFGVVAASTLMAGVSTYDTMATHGGRQYAKLGKVSVGENLDRLISYDGSGFIEGVGRISNGDPEIMKDMVEEAFDKSNQRHGAFFQRNAVSGDIVFALHNMREG